MLDRELEGARGSTNRLRLTSNGQRTDPSTKPTDTQPTTSTAAADSNARCMGTPTARDIYMGARTARDITCATTVRLSLIHI